MFWNCFLIPAVFNKFIRMIEWRYVYEVEKLKLFPQMFNFYVGSRMVYILMDRINICVQINYTFTAL